MSDDLAARYERLIEAAYRELLIEHRRMTGHPLDAHEAALAKLAVGWGFTKGFDAAVRVAAEACGEAAP